MDEAVNDRWMREHPEATQYSGLSKYQFRRLRKSGDGPDWAKQGNTILYRKSVLDAWLQSRVVKATCERPLSQAQRSHLESLHAARRASKRA